MKPSFYLLGLTTALIAHAALAVEGTPPPAKPAGDLHTKLGDQHFMTADTDKNGMISKSEWQAKGEAMFNEIDATKDGNVSREEMSSHHKAKFEEMMKRREQRTEKLDAKKEKIAERKEKIEEHLKERAEKKVLPPAAEAPVAPAAPAAH